MKIENLIWLHHIIDKLTFKHHVDITEVEEVFDSRPKLRFLQKAIAKERMFTWLWEELRLDAI
jgi:hypothetical protein